MISDFVPAIEFRRIERPGARGQPRWLLRSGSSHNISEIKSDERDMGKLVSLEAARVARWERKRTDPWKAAGDDALIWTCNCGCWQYELRPTGAFCVSCGAKQSVSIKV